MTLSRRLGTLSTATLICFGMYTGGLHLARISGRFEIAPASGCGGNFGRRMGRSRRKQPVHWRGKNRSVLPSWNLNFSPSGKLSLHARKRSGEAAPMCSLVCFRERPIPGTPHAHSRRGCSPECDGTVTLREEWKKRKIVGPLLPLLPLAVQKKERATQCFVMPLSSWGPCSARGPCAWTVPGRRWSLRRRRRRGVFGRTNFW